MTRPPRLRTPTKSCAAWTSCCGDCGKRAGARVQGGIRTGVDSGARAPKEPRNRHYRRRPRSDRPDDAPRGWLLAVQRSPSRIAGRAAASHRGDQRDDTLNAREVEAENFDPCPSSPFAPVRLGAHRAPPRILSGFSFLTDLTRDPTREGVGLVDFRLGPDEPAQTEPSRRRDRPRARSWRVDGVRHADAPRRAHQAQGVTSPDTATTCGGARLDIGVMTVQERRSP